jgi:hypothetical protein
MSKYFKPIESDPTFQKVSRALQPMRIQLRLEAARKQLKQIIAFKERLEENIEKMEYELEQKGVL